MSEPIPSTSASRLIESLSQKSGVPQVYITRTLAASLISAYSFKKIIFPVIRKYQNGDFQGLRNPLKQNKNKENSAKLQKNDEKDDESVIAATHIASSNDGSGSSTAAVDKEFFFRLWRLLKIMFPGLFTAESGLLCAHSITLIARTVISIHVALLEGRMVKYIVRKDGYNFAWMMIRWFSIAVPATFVNSLIRYLEKRLALAFRSRLVDHAYGLYFRNQTYYRVSNLDSRIENADHRLTDEISAFTSAVAHLYSHVSKPILDIVLVLWELRFLTKQRKGNVTLGPLISTATVVATGHILRVCSPKFGKLVAEESSRKGYLRYIHSRIITNAEEIAFYGGHNIERNNLRKAYESLKRQSMLIFNKRLWFVMLEQFLMKYGWAGMGMVSMAIPIFTSTETGGSGSRVSERTEYYTTAKQLLSSGADAGERLMTAYKEVVEMAGYTERVDTLMTVLNDCAKNKYKRKIASEAIANSKTGTNVDKTDSSRSKSEPSSKPAKRKPSVCLEFDSNGAPIIQGLVTESLDDTILLENVPIVTPNCDIVVPSLSLKVTKGMHLLISGPNGCGKSSLFRIVSGLWPVYKGYLRKPSSLSLFYIPQRPYMSVGSLRDQVIYPDTYADMKRRGLTDNDLEDILEIVHLKHIIRREGGWSTVGDWKDILSGGEKQRMGMARIFYHKPQYALLDECTSAVSIDVEGEMYQAAKSSGITLLTITHRPSLWKYHTHILQFDGEGGWKLEPLDTGKMMTLQEERSKLESQLAGVASLEERLKEIRGLLGEETEEGMRESFYSQDNSNSEESPVEIIA